MTPERVARLKLDQILAIEVLGRHGNRLRPGHHAGNRFRLVIRDVASHAKETVPTVLSVLLRRGVPNYPDLSGKGRAVKTTMSELALLPDSSKRAQMSRSKRMWYLNSFQSSTSIRFSDAAGTP